MRWRVDLPGPGNSSPIVWGNRVFVTQFVKSENRRTVMCFDRVAGKLLWQSGVTYTERESTQQNNPFCAATPVTDGERVIASFGSAGLYCYDFDGKELWHRDLGKINHMFGNASSPVIHGDRCFLHVGPDEKSRLVAVDKRTGEIAWNVEAPKVDPSEQPPMIAGGGAGPGANAAARFNIGTPVAPEIFSQADKNADKKVNKEEFVAVADLWFDKIDGEKSGKLSAEQFAAKFYDAVPAKDESGEPRRGPSRTTAPAFFTAADNDKDGSLSRAELKGTFAEWFANWDSANAGLNEEKLRDGLNAVLLNVADLPIGGRGGAGGRGGGAAGRGGFTGPPPGSWSTSIIVRASGRDELIMNFPNRLAAYDPNTGKQLWISKGLDTMVYTTPLWHDGTVVAMSARMNGGTAIALKPGGSGDVTESQRLWRLEQIKGRFGSGVIHEGHIYGITDNGLAECFELKTGKRLWEERLKGPGAKSSSRWSSMILADGKIYVPNQSGDVFALRANPTFEVLATNSVSEPTNASLAASDGDLFLRTDKSLWCFANAK